MYYPPDGPAVVRVNIFVRSISKIDDVTMVSARNIKLNNNNNKIKKKSKIKSLPSKNNNNNSKKARNTVWIENEHTQPWLRPCLSKCSTVRVCLCMWLCIAKAIPAICVPSNFQIEPTLFQPLSISASLSLSLTLSPCLSLSRFLSKSLCLCLSCQGASV